MGISWELREANASGPWGDHAQVSFTNLTEAQTTTTRLTASDLALFITHLMELHHEMLKKVTPDD